MTAESKGKKKSAKKAQRRQTEPEKGSRLSYRYRIYPTEEQKHQIDVNLGCSRWVFNHYLQARKDAYERTQTEVSRPKPLIGEDGTAEIDEKGRVVYERTDDGKVVYHMVDNMPPAGTYDPSAKSMSLFDTSKDLTRVKKEVVDEEGHAWLNDADAQALIYSLRHLDAAYQMFFKGVKNGLKIGYPKFKGKKNEVQTYTTGAVQLCGYTPGLEEVKVDAVPSPLPEDWRHADVTWNRIQLPKLGKVRAKIHRLPEGKFVAASVTKGASGRYYVALNVKECEIAKAAPAEGEVGVTYGVSHWAVTSDGEVHDLPERIQHLERRLAIAQRDLARKKPGSANYRKAKRRVARCNERIANLRSVETHRLTRELVDSYGTIASRKMESQEMQQHKGKATKNLPAKVRRKLNHDVQGGNFFEINRQLEYKSAWAGRAFVAVPDDTPTAQVCNRCGHEETVLAESLRQSWTCPKCGARHDRKANGAQNVLEAGLDILAEQERSYVSKAKSRRAADRAASAE